MSDPELGFEAEVVAVNLPTFQTKIAEYKQDQILFTQPDGIYLLDIARKKVEPFLAVPDCKDIWVTITQQVYIARNIGAARYKPKEGIQIVGGGFSSKVFLVGNKNDVWVIADEYDRSIQMRDNWEWYIPSTLPAPTIIKLSEQLGDEQRDSTIFLGGSVNNVALVGNNQFLALTERWGENFLLTTLNGHKQSMWYGLRNDHLHPKAALHLPSGQVLAALAGVQALMSLAPKSTFLKPLYTYGIELCVGDISADTPTSIAQLNILGDHIALARSMDGGGYLLAPYVLSDQEIVGILIRWRWQPSL